MRMPRAFTICIPFTGSGKTHTMMGNWQTYTTHIHLYATRIHHVHTVHGKWSNIYDTYTFSYHTHSPYAYRPQAVVKRILWWTTDKHIRHIYIYIRAFTICIPSTGSGQTYHTYPFTLSHAFTICIPFTGSGKTHTMMGNDKHIQHIYIYMPRAFTICIPSTGSGRTYTTHIHLHTTCIHHMHTVRRQWQNAYYDG